MRHARRRKKRHSPGRLADLVMLDRNLFEIATETLRDARVLLTVVGGRPVFRKATT
jgi:predicted amidohydrolase YtcJ